MLVAAELTLECAGKLVYATAPEAYRALSHLQRRTRGDRSDVKPYRCRDCDGWHLGREKRLTGRRK